MRSFHLMRAAEKMPRWIHGERMQSGAEAQQWYVARRAADMRNAGIAEEREEALRGWQAQKANQR